MSTDRKIIVALDGLSKGEALSLASELSDIAWGFKAHELFIREGFSIISELKKYGNVFADFKFHDIPATVEKEVVAVIECGADLVTVHASGGHTMLEAAVNAGGEKVVAITALTSLTLEDTQTIYGRTPEETVKTLAEIASSAGVSNVVCSPQEIDIVKAAAPKVHIITPGIRGPNDETQDQKRTLSAKEAITSGAHLLVIGRPITKAPHPRAALEEIVRSIV